jgi:type II secretory pathway predicted ATPase ExeA
MYQTHWGLAETPFRSRFDRRFFYQGPAQDEAMARLHFLVEQRRRLGILLGESGSGKTVLLETFAAGLRASGRAVARLNLVGIEAAEFLGLLAQEFGLTPDLSLAAPSLWRIVDDRLAEYRYQALDCVVLLDDADLATPGVLTQVARLAKNDLAPHSRLTIVLAGQEPRIGRIGQELLELAELRIDLEPWEEPDTDHYLRTLLAKAGRETPVFSPMAITRLHDLTQGIPRRINQLADLALLAGADRKLAEIDVDTIDSIWHELGAVETSLVAE